MLSLVYGAPGNALAKPAAESLVHREPAIFRSPRLVSRWRWRVLIVLGGGALAGTLMACGGGPPCTGLALCSPPDMSVPTDMAGGVDGGG